MHALSNSLSFDHPTEVNVWLRQLAATAVSAVHPDTLLSAGQLPPRPAGRTVVIGAGKAAAAMAAAFERTWADTYDDADLSGLVVTRYGHGAECRHIEVLEASHPMPDELGEKAAQRMLESVAGLTENDLVVALISGGGSALMTLPAPGLTLQQKQAINKTLLRCGAPIREINTVRRHLSRVKGGRLAVAAHPARVITYLISDVPGDDPALIASGPTIPDATTPMDALEILERYSIDIPEAVRSHLVSDDTAPKPHSPEFGLDRTIVQARACDALRAAEASANLAGVDVRVLGDDPEGEARELGGEHATMALKLQKDLKEPLLILSGGETSVTVSGEGRGGRNVEYLLGAIPVLQGASNIHALAIDTDGIDGSEDNAGAIFGPNDWSRVQALKLDPATYLARNDAYSFFEALDGLIITGPTRTNVNDFRAILVLPKSM